ncbi:MAG: hypothetical protein K1X72_19395 [Pyrinomonadaceae bacterium]|nr:hypothetical protein [Pyrinomonadaceae bacterium]
MTNKMKLVNRFLILLMLCAGIGFVTFSTNTKSVEAAYRCCETCPGYNLYEWIPDQGAPELNLGNIAGYCNSQCDPEDLTCFENCNWQVNQCYQNCRSCDPMGPFTEVAPAITCHIATGICYRVVPDVPYDHIEEYLCHHYECSQ